MTDECLEHLARFVKRPSERMKLYEAQKWRQLSQLATSGILENLQKVNIFWIYPVYCSLASLAVELCLIV